MSQKMPAAPRFFIIAWLLGAAAFAQAPEPLFELALSNHQFVPETIRVPAERRFQLAVRNADATAEEFESYALHREKLIPAGRRVVIFLGPLKAGEYVFFGEFHSATAKGRLIAE